MVGFYVEVMSAMESLSGPGQVCLWSKLDLLPNGKSQGTTQSCLALVVRLRGEKSITLDGRIHQGTALYFVICMDQEKLQMVIVPHFATLACLASSD